MTTSNHPHFDLLRAIILLLLVFISIGIMMYGMKTGKPEILTLGATFSIVTILLGKKWTT